MVEHEDGSVTLTKDEYESLMKDSDFLSALEAAGVDNWEGYDEAIRISKDFDE